MINGLTAFLIVAGAGALALVLVYLMFKIPFGKGDFVAIAIYGIYVLFILLLAALLFEPWKFI